MAPFIKLSNPYALSQFDHSHPRGVEFSPGLGWHAVKWKGTAYRGSGVTWRFMGRYKRSYKSPNIAYS